jgi:MFS family permease
VVLMMLFLIIEACVRNPLVPPRLFRSRALTVANMAAAFWGAALFAWFFLCALYLQRMLGKNAMEIGIAFLPTNLVVSVLSLGFSARLVSRFGIRISFVVGFFLAALGLALFAVTPLKPDMLKDILPGMILFGAGAGVAFNPLMLSAVSGVESKDSGLASGLINTSTMMGGALGIAVLASVASAWMGKLSLAGADAAAALNGAYHVAFAMCAVFAFTAAILGIVYFPRELRGNCLLRRVLPRVYEVAARSLPANSDRRSNTARRPENLQQTVPSRAWSADLTGTAGCPIPRRPSHTTAEPARCPTGAFLRQGCQSQ